MKAQLRTFKFNFWDRLSHCSPHCPGTSWVAQAVLRVVAVLQVFKDRNYSYKWATSLHHQRIKIQDVADVWPVTPRKTWTSHRWGETRARWAGGVQDSYEIFKVFFFFFFWIVSLHDGYLPKAIEGPCPGSGKWPGKSESVSCVGWLQGLVDSGCPVPKSWHPELFVFCSL